jgi:enoyl-CoA hydratase/carnithine racemase
MAKEVCALLLSETHRRSALVGDSALVTVDHQNKVAVVTMALRPYNLSGPILYTALLTAFEEAVKSGSRAILLRSGLRHFCAGADVAT